MTLVEFLLARISEDEQRVYAADSDGEFRVAWVTFRRRDGSMDWTTVAADHRDDVWVAGGSEYQSDTRVIIDEPFYDARRVLAECEAKRRIIDISERMLADVVDGADSQPAITTATSNLLLHLLAAPYSDHPQFDLDWRVQ